MQHCCKITKVLREFERYFSKGLSKQKPKNGSLSASEQARNTKLARCRIVMNILSLTSKNGTSWPLVTAAPSLTIPKFSKPSPDYTTFYWWNSLKSDGRNIFPKFLSDFCRRANVFTLVLFVLLKIFIFISEEMIKNPTIKIDKF